MKLSVIICTHNPREHYLDRTIAALKAQTCPTMEWELLLIDNASQKPLADKLDLSWQPNARHVRENELGLTCARLRGIEESKGEILVFIDDDNLAEANYLKFAIQIFEDHLFLGVIGGKIVGEYEQPPPNWMARYLNHLAIVDMGESELYALTPGMEPFVPYGAGLVVRRSVALYYVKQIKDDVIRRKLDAIGDQLSRAGDTDMALCAFDLKLAKGYYPQLKLTHLIPARRFSMDYLLRLFEDGEQSRTCLLLLRGLVQPPRPIPVWRRWARQTQTWVRERFTDKQIVRLEHALQKGRKRAYTDYTKIQVLDIGDPSSITPNTDSRKAV